MRRGNRIPLIASLAILSLFAPPPKAQSQDPRIQEPAAQVTPTNYYIPLPISDTGLSPVSAGYFGGVRDYLALLNERDGGIGGVRVVWDECETEYDPAQGFECYQLQKKSELGEALYFDALTLSFHPLSARVLPRFIVQSRRDRLPVVGVHRERIENRRGDVFPYQFPFGPSAYDFAHAAIKHMGARLGGVDKLKGLTIATLYHGSPYGRETNAFLDHLGEQYGFRHEAIEVNHPGNEQGSQWLTVRKLKPAFVFLRGWGLMNPAAILTAVRTGYTASNIIGGEWSNSDEDVLPAGKAADGYQALTVQRTGADYPTAREITERLYNQGQGSLEEREQVGSGYWNLGVWMAVLSTEAVRVAQKRFGKNLSGAMMRWGLENVSLSQADLERIGIADMAPPIRLRCADHGALAKVRVHQWSADNQEWSIVSDGWIDGYSDFSSRTMNERAERYIERHPEFPRRDCDDPEDRDDFDL